MRIITLVIGKKGAGKSKWIFEKKDKMLSEEWVKIDAEKETDYNQAKRMRTDVLNIQDDDIEERIELQNKLR